MKTGAPTDVKAMPAIGVWDAFDAVRLSAGGRGRRRERACDRRELAAGGGVGRRMVRMGIADERGDGRPDYAYNGWLLYADTVYPRAPAGLGRARL